MKERALYTRKCSNLARILKPSHFSKPPLKKRLTSLIKNHS